MKSGPLVSFFEPFAGRTENISGQVAKELERDKVLLTPLPVVFGEAFEVLEAQLKTLKPSAVVMLGEALGSPRMRLERCAHNWMHSKLADNKGQKMWNQSIDPQGQECLLTSAPLLKLLSPGVDGVHISLSAGSYVCNQLYYQILQRYAETMPCIFIHVTDKQSVEDQADWIRSLLPKLTLSE